MKKILIITGGNKTKIEDFQTTANHLNLPVYCASFSELNFNNLSSSPIIMSIGDIPVEEFGLIYIRLIGKRLEEATLLTRYAREKNIPIVDSLYNDEPMMPSSVAKSVESLKLLQAGVSMPKTIFGGVEFLRSKSEVNLGFPYVIKSTSGRKAREVYAPKTKEELEALYVDILEREKKGEQFFAQEFINTTQRVRVFVIEGKAVAAITRPTKWRKRVLEPVDGVIPEGEKKALDPIPENYAQLAIQASRAAGLDISGVDIIEDIKTSTIYVIEANAAPSWKLVKKDTGMNVEEVILQFLFRRLDSYVAN
jgi:glutathione synthase/RimK-type ligase-like ATP-grasp enzyme